MVTTRSRAAPAPTHAAASASTSSPWPWQIPHDLLPHICQWLSERETWRTIRGVCQSFQAAVDSESFFRMRWELAPLATLHKMQLGSDIRVARCALVHRSDCCFPSIYGGDHARKYLSQPGLDISHGKEKFPLTLSPVFMVEDRIFYGELPEAVRPTPWFSDAQRKEHFQYDAGPVKAPVRLQIFRCGSQQGYGLRVLEEVAAGAMVSTYWGRYAVDPYAVRQQSGIDATYVLSVSRRDPWSDQCPGQDQWSGSVAGSDPWPDFIVDGRFTGNGARWINHSTSKPNLEARLLPERHSFTCPVTGTFFSLPIVAFYSLRPLDAGEELLWDYTQPIRRPPGVGQLYGIRKQAPINGRMNPWENELVRDADTHDLYSARWGGDDEMSHPEFDSTLEEEEYWERLDRLCEVEGVNAHGIFPTEPALPARDATWDGWDWWTHGWGAGEDPDGHWWRRLLRYWPRYPLEESLQSGSCARAPPTPPRNM